MLWLPAENAETPYSATVVIDDIKYGTGYASSKRAAKLEAGMCSALHLVKFSVKTLNQDFDEFI